MPKKHFSPLIYFLHASIKKHLLETFLQKKIPLFQTFCSFISLILYEPFENNEDTADISGNISYVICILMECNEIKKQQILELYVEIA